MNIPLSYRFHTAFIPLSCRFTERFERGKIADSQPCFSKRIKRSNNAD